MTTGAAALGREGIPEVAAALGRMHGCGAGRQGRTNMIGMAAGWLRPWPLRCRRVVQEDDPSGVTVVESESTWPPGASSCSLAP